MLFSEAPEIYKRLHDSYERDDIFDLQSTFLELLVAINIAGYAWRANEYDRKVVLVLAFRLIEAELRKHTFLKASTCELKGDEGDNAGESSPLEAALVLVEAMCGRDDTILAQVLVMDAIPMITELLCRTGCGCFAGFLQSLMAIDSADFDVKRMLVSSFDASSLSAQIVNMEASLTLRMAAVDRALNFVTRMRHSLRELRTIGEPLLEASIACLHQDCSFMDGTKDGFGVKCALLFDKLEFLMSPEAVIALSRTRKDDSFFVSNLLSIVAKNLGKRSEPADLTCVRALAKLIQFADAAFLLSVLDQDQGLETIALTVDLAWEFNAAVRFLQRGKDLGLNGSVVMWRLLKSDALWRRCLFHLRSTGSETAFFQRGIVRFLSILVESASVEVIQAHMKHIPLIQTVIHQLHYYMNEPFCRHLAAASLKKATMKACLSEIRTIPAPNLVPTLSRLAALATNPFVPDGADFFWLSLAMGMNFEKTRLLILQESGPLVFSARVCERSMHLQSITLILLHCQRLRLRSSLPLSASKTSLPTKAMDSHDRLQQLELKIESCDREHFLLLSNNDIWKSVWTALFY